MLLEEARGTQENAGTRHTSVLLDAAVDGLIVGGEERVVDATLGGGGHTLALRERIASGGGRLLALDADQEAVQRFRERQARLGIPESEVKAVRANFADLGAVLESEAFTPVDAILADLGYSSDQIEAPERGLAFMQDGPLDMRLDQESGQTAADVVAACSEADLTRIFREYGEEPESRSLARALVVARREMPFRTTGQLRDFVLEHYPARAKRKLRIHPATRVFQALRIEVNDELRRLSRFLEAAVEALRPGGRLGVITFHSGEDRIVKQFFRRCERPCVCPKEFPVCRCEKVPTLRLVTRHATLPSAQEVAENPRARSAKLRIAERV